MLKKSTILAAAAFGLVGVAASSVQAAPAVDKKWELTLAGSGTNDNDFEDGTFTVNGTVGYYFNDQVEVNVRQGVTYSNFDDDNFSGSTKLGVDYHFDYGQDQRIIPFVGVSIGYVYGDLTNDTTVLSPEGGVKFYVNDTTFIFAEVSYDFSLKDSISDGAFNYGLGIGFRF